jgi:hypothetical protein
MASATQTERKVTAAATRMLVGRRLVRVRYMAAEEAAELGWSHRPAVLEFEGGVVLYVACDEEANDTGVLFAEAGDSDLCLGRLPA